MTTRHHALETALTRSPAPANANGPPRRPSQRLDACLPTDVITTHHPDAHGLLPNDPLPPAADSDPRTFSHARQEDHRVIATVHLPNGTTPTRLLAAVAYAPTPPQGPTE